jgi:hypothetical protein
MRLIRKFPFITYAVCCVLSLVGIRMLGRAGEGYDDHGLGTAAFLLKMLWNVFAFPFYLFAEMLSSLNGGRSYSGLGVDAWVMGIGSCILAEVALHLWRRARNRTGS